MTRRMIIVLTSVMVFSGLVLAATSVSLSPRIEENRIAALNASLASIFTDESTSVEDLDFEELDTDGPTIYRGATDDGRLLGYAIRVVTQGYGGGITMIVGVSPDLESILGIEIVEQLETPGLGGNITNEPFKAQFTGLAADEPFSYVRNVEPARDENEIQAISGATITSRAIVSGMNATLGDALEIIRRQVR